MTELWKDVVGYEGLYQVSNMGRVRRDGRVLSTPQDSNGYCITVLCKDGERRSAKVHRLVADAFIENPNGYAEVNHLDECKANNRVDNLEWCTRLHNIRHGTGIKRHADAQRNRHGSMEICQFLPDGTLAKTFPSVREVSRVLGFDRAFVTRCAKGKHPFAYGYKWEFTGEVTH